MGYKVVIGKNVNKQKGFVAASEDERAWDLNYMFKNDGIDAVFVTQGGYGSAQILDKIDYEAIKKSPKIFTGFSDITSLHLAMNKFSNLMTFHGPGMARFNSEDLTEYTKKQFFKAIAGHSAQCYSRQLQSMDVQRKADTDFWKGCSFLKT